MNRTEYLLVLILALITQSCICKKENVAILKSEVMTGIGILGHTSTALKDESFIIVGGVEKQITRKEILRFKDGVVTTIGSLQKARYHHTETLLPNGHILITGGYHVDAGNQALSEIEEVDLATGSSNVVANLKFARAGHTAVLLSDGRILIAGGANGQPLNTAELYDYKKKRILRTLTMKESRSNFDAITLPSGKVILIGGHGSNMKSIELFNPKKNTFSNAGFLHFGRFIHKSILLDNGKILITGGFNLKETMSEVELYDISTQKSTVLQPMSSRRDGHSLIKTPNGKIIVLGGADLGGLSSATQVFDPSTNKFSAGSSIDYPVEGHTANLLHSGKILIYGGNFVVPWYLFDPEIKYQKLKNQL